MNKQGSEGSYGGEVPIQLEQISETTFTVSHGFV